MDSLMDVMEVVAFTCNTCAETLRLCLPKLLRVDLPLLASSLSSRQEYQICTFVVEMAPSTITEDACSTLQNLNKHTSDHQSHNAT